MIAECPNLIQANDIKSRSIEFKAFVNEFDEFLNSIFMIDLNLMFQLLDRIPNIEPLLADLESYIISEGLMVMRANSETITTVRTSISISLRILIHDLIHANSFKGSREICRTTFRIV